MTDKPKKGRPELPEGDKKKNRAFRMSDNDYSEVVAITGKFGESIHELLAFYRKHHNQ